MTQGGGCRNKAAMAGGEALRAIEAGFTDTAV